MRLADLYRGIEQIARQTGRVKRAALPGGAAIVVKIDGDVHKVMFERKTKPLGDVELITFRRHCAIPDEATRFPPEGQGNTTIDDQVAYYVGYSWRDEGP